MEQKPAVKHIIRVANTDLEGAKPVYLAMKKIKGISFSFSSMLCHIAGISKDKKAGSLTEAEVTKLNEIIKEPLKFNAPAWMLNRRKDYETGKDIHLITSDRQFTQENDIKRMRMIKSYKGSRHSAGRPARGQRTKSNFRRSKAKGGTTLGVQKKKVQGEQKKVQEDQKKVQGGKK